MNNNTEQYNDVLNTLQDYMLYEDNMIKSLRNKIDPIPKDIRSVKNTNVTKQQLFIPNQHDTLFWCFYIIKNGDIKYETLANRNSLTTKQIKIDYVSKIRENKQIVKTYKFDTITSLESNLANDNNINIKTIMTLCAIDNINLIFVSRKTYYEFLMNESSDIYVIREIDSQSKYIKKYGFEIANNNMLEEIRNTLYKVETLDKPIKSLSSYKLSDLVDIASKLAIEILNKETGKKKTKNELYESLIQYF